MTVTVEASYLTVRPHAQVAGQRHLSPGLVVDVDDQDRIVGVETIGEAPLLTVLGQLLEHARFPKEATP